MKQVTKQTYQIFWQHTKRYRLKFWTIALGVMLGNAITIIIPFYYKRFFDTLATSTSINLAVPELQHILFIILAWNALLWAIFRLNVFINVKFQPRVMSDILNTCFGYLHEHSFGFFVNRFVGSLVRKVNRLVGAFEAVTDALFWSLIGTAFKILAITAVVSFYNLTLGLILFVWSIIYLTINYILSLRKLKYDEASAACDSRVTGYLSDTLTNNANVKLFTAYNHEAVGYAKLTNEQCILRQRSWYFDANIEAVQVAFMVGLEFCLFWFGIKLWQQGIITIGTFVLIQAYLIQLFERLWDFGRVIRKVYQHLADAEEMVEILHTPHQVQNKSKAKSLKISQGELEFRDVNFIYTDSREVISHFNLKLAVGEKVGLVGPSGAGKSTLVALVLRFFDVTTGGIFIDGQNIKDVTQESLRHSISMVPQDTVLFHRTLLENIRYGRREATDAEVKRAATLAHCDEFIKKLPHGYDTLVGERGIKLSGGERQRVAIARAILKDAPILILDEATSSLDSEAEGLIQSALQNLMQGRTTLVIAHRLSTIMKMDRIVVIDDGAVQEIGTHQQLIKKNDGLYNKLWQLQAGGFIG